jgi:hypothetical protein
MKTAYKAFPTEFFLDFAIIMTFSVIYVSVKIPLIRKWRYEKAEEIWMRLFRQMCSCIVLHVLAVRSGHHHPGES